MREMLANKYLLNGEAAKAMELYEEALENDPDQADLRCRLILAQLAQATDELIAPLEEVAVFIAATIENGGKQHLARLVTGCKGYARHASEPGEGAALKGLKALLAGHDDQALSWLAKVDPKKHPAVALLEKRLRRLLGQVAAGGRP